MREQIIPLKARRHVEAMKSIIRARYPEAEFRVTQRREPVPGTYMEAYINDEDGFEVIDLVCERTVDILIDEGLSIFVIPMPKLPLAVPEQPVRRKDAPNSEPGPLLVVISGPSGVGKDSVLDALKRRGRPLHFVVTSTTRAPRPGEVDGVDYFFVSEPRFQEMIAQGELLEWAKVYGDFKGVPKSSIFAGLDRGVDVIMRTDVQGAASIRRMAPDAVLIFLAPTSLEELEARLRARSTESPEELALRLNLARQEMAQIPAFDYVVVNREGALDEAADAVEAILRAEHSRTLQRRVRMPS